MEKMTQAEYDALPRDEHGIKHCPGNTDYSEIRDFGSDVRFGSGASFGNFSKFGNCASFGSGASFGDRANFGICASFGSDVCFGDWASFGEDAEFLAGASFESGRLTNATYIAVDRIGSEQRKAYFFRADEGFYVRTGCWFGTFVEFADRVKEVRSGTKHERDYLAALELAKTMLDYEEE
jgi:hypothetical protein